MKHSSSLADEQKQLKLLEHPLLKASDAQISSVVALIDGMQDRGSADDLLEALRPRLRMQQPPRRMTLNRLMFLPLSPLIVEPVYWRSKSLTIPRNALACIAAHVRDGMGEQAASIDAQLAGATFQDRLVVMRYGMRVWQLSSAILTDKPAPWDWRARTGFAVSEYKNMAARIAMIMREGMAIEQIAMQSADGMRVADRDLRACLNSIVAQVGLLDTPTALHTLSMFICGLLARTGAFEQIIMIAEELPMQLSSPIMRKAAEQAIQHMLGDANHMLQTTTKLSDLISQLDRVATLLDTMEKGGPNGPPANQNRITQLRRNFDANCRLRFENEVLINLIGRVEKAGLMQTKADVEQLETIAQGLRSLERVSRRFGSASYYAKKLTEAVQALSLPPPLSEPTGAATNIIDRARLLEILQGPEAGLAFMKSVGIG